MTVQLARLLDIMAKLRDPETGCPWDVAQSFATIAPYTIEEAYEVADAIEMGDMAGLREELGDLLLQVVFHARMAEEDGQFDFNAVAASISDKMVRRHPHVFGDAVFDNLAEQKADWEAHKSAERAAKAASKAQASKGQTSKGQRASVLDGVPSAMPALMRCEKLGKRAAQVGFTWADVNGAMDKLEEELDELKAEMQTPGTDRVLDEVGDVLFSVVNVARHLRVDPEAALRHANAKFEKRFHSVEESFAVDDLSIADADLVEMEARWQVAKKV